MHTCAQTLAMDLCFSYSSVGRFLSPSLWQACDFLGYFCLPVGSMSTWSLLVYLLHAVLSSGFGPKQLCYLPHSAFLLRLSRSSAWHVSIFYVSLHEKENHICQVVMPITRARRKVSYNCIGLQSKALLITVETRLTEGCDPKYGHLFEK